MSIYEQERQLLTQLWETAPRECPHCKTAINQHKPGYYSNEKPRYHCGSDACRAAAGRATARTRHKKVSRFGLNVTQKV
jgi:transposase-like protein